ncbi:MAG: hypothetical protein VYC39_02860 [Myxococcota bacterium]|nr:hypothetical protein [Myxococcota bacterium]
MLRLVLVTALALAACGGETGDEVDTTRPDASTGINGPDRDGDEWTDDIDNCPDLPNYEQRDRDRDGIGNECDTCPSTPNNDPTGLTQSQCELNQETEPNNDTAQAQVLSLPMLGEAVAISGIVEAPLNAKTAPDRYVIMAPGQSAVRIRCARGSYLSLLEPQIEVSGGSYTVSRIVDGQHIAERIFYFSEAGTYEIAISDRRGRKENVKKGNLDYAYELSIQTVILEAEQLTLPITDRSLRVEPKGQVAVYEASIMPTEQLRLEIKTPLGPGEDGYDPILVVENEDGSLWEENHVYTDERADARLLLQVDKAETIRIIVDHRELVGREAVPQTLSIDYPDQDAELEPNDSRELASDLSYCQGCETRGIIANQDSGIADIDWYSFQATAGQIVSFRGLVPPNSQIDPYIALGQFESSLFVPIYENGTSSGVSARFDAIIPETGEYFLRFEDEQNKEKMSGPYRGGGLYTYTIFTEFLVLAPSPELESGVLTNGVINPGGSLHRYLITTSDRIRVDFSLDYSRLLTDFAPLIRVYEPGATKLIAEGGDGLNVTLPSSGSYVVTVHNSDGGIGGPEYSYELTANRSSF